MQSPVSLTNLSHLAQIFHASLDIDEVLESVMAQSVQAMRASVGAIFLRDANRQLLPRITHGLDLSVSLASTAHPLRELALAVAEDNAPRRGPSSCTLAAPIQSDNDFLGVLVVERTLAFEKSEQDLLCAIAQASASAIQNALLYDQAQHRLKNLQLLHEISADLTSTLDLDCVLTESLKRVQNVLQVESATILFREGDELVFRIAIGETADRIKPFRLKMGQGFTGLVAQDARADFTNDLPNDPRYYRQVDAEINFVTHSLIAAPLIVNGTVIGVISATNKPTRFDAGDLDLLTTIAGSAAIAIENARLYQVAVEKGRMERELQVARQVQADLIPREQPHFPGWDMAGMWQPAREVGGDYYDFVATSKHFDLIIADVSDKGMPAALLMAQTRSIIRASLAPMQTLAHGVTRANELVCASSAGNMFVTMACVRLDARSGKLICVNAGHNRPLICRARSGELLELARTGIALGIEADRNYMQRVERLSRGDLIVLYTDGVTDAMNAAGDFFGEERLQQLILDNRRASAGELIAVFETTLKEFIGASAPTDDITVVVAKKT